jgi:hypothetical protein
MKAVSLDRTLRARHDLDWLPPSFKVVRWTVAGTLWSGLAALLGGALAFAKPGLFIYGKGIAVLFAGGYYAGDRAARAVLRRRLARLASGRLDLTRLQHEPDGELVHVRGRVKATETLPSLDGAPVVYRRVVFSIGAERWVHEAGHDFYLVDDTGERVLVTVGDARLIAAEPKRRRVEGEAAREVFDLTLEPQLRGRTDLKLRVSRRDRGAISCGEVTLREGDAVEIVGYKTRSVDPTVASRLERDTPMRATLRAGRDLPLLISPTG